MISTATSAVDISKGEFKSEVKRRRQKWSEKTLIETLDHGNPQCYLGVYVAVISLLTYPVSTCTAERSFSSMKRLKTPLQSTMTDGRLSSLTILHIHKHKDFDIDDVITDGPFACEPPVFTIGLSHFLL